MIDFDGLTIPEAVAASQLPAPASHTLAEFGGICADAPIYLLDSKEAYTAFSSAGESPLHELPPLPFPRFAVETEDQMGFCNVGGEKRGEHWGSLFAFAISGNESPGWMCTYLFALREERDPLGRAKRGSYRLSRVTLPEMGPPVGAMNMDEDGRIRGGHELDSREAEFHWRLPVEVVHLITARGVDVERLDVPRPVRRRYARMVSEDRTYPELHLVKIREAGERDSGDGSGREYHCRWLVRGHWRHLAGGRRTWVRSHIKGPAGKPWRGTPVYVREQEGVPVAHES